VETTFASIAFSQPLSRIFPAPKKDFFAKASTTRNKEKCANAFESPSIGI